MSGAPRCYVERGVRQTFQSRTGGVLAHRRLVGRGLPRALAGKLLRVWLNDAIYDSATLEEALKHSFGADVPLMAPTGDGPAVAITTTTPGTPACALFTTYNKNSHPALPSYAWHQRHSPGRDIRVWEA